MGCRPAMIGVMPDDLEVDLYARGGNVCEGYLYPISPLQGLAAGVIAADTDPTTGAAYVVSKFPGGAGSTWSFVKGGGGVASSDQYSCYYAIAMEDVLDEKKGKFKVRGIVKAYVKDINNTAITIGRPLVDVAGVISLCDAGSATVAGAPTKYVGFALEAGSGTPSVASKLTILFDGWHGFGGGNALA